MENVPKVLFGVHLPLWIVTYPLDNVIHYLNNWGLVGILNASGSIQKAQKCYLQPWDLRALNQWYSKEKYTRGLLCIPSVCIGMSSAIESFTENFKIYLGSL